MISSYIKKKAFVRIYTCTYIICIERKTCIINNKPTPFLSIPPFFFLRVRSFLQEYIFFFLSMTNDPVNGRVFYYFYLYILTSPPHAQIVRYVYRETQTETDFFFIIIILLFKYIYDDDIFYQ